MFFEHKLWNVQFYLYRQLLSTSHFTIFTGSVLTRSKIPADISKETQLDTYKNDMKLLQRCTPNFDEWVERVLNGKDNEKVFIFLSLTLINLPI